MNETPVTERGPEPTPEGPAGPIVVVPPRRSSPGPVIFVGSMLMAVLTLGPAVLVMTGVGRTEREPEPTATPLATVRTAPPAGGGAQRTQVPAGGPVRVISSSGSATALSGGGYQVTFIWTVEGAREGDPIKVHFYAGSRLMAEREGALDPQIFAFSTGQLRIVTDQECSATGWRADLVTVRGQTPAGETLASVPGASCR